MVCGKIDDDGEENVEVVLEVCYCKRSRTCVATSLGQVRLTDLSLDR
jgi:hypothetical protein